MNILVVFAVRQTINTPTTITIRINTQNAHDAAIVVRCTEHHEDSLIKILFILLRLRMK